MIGAEIIPGGKQLIAERTPTAIERQHWGKTVNILNRVLTKVYALKLLNYYVAAQAKFADKAGIQIFKPVELEQRLLAVDASAERIKKAVRGVQDQVLGIQYKNGKLNIVRPKEGDLGVAPVLIAIAAGAVVGVIIYGVVDLLIVGDEECDALIPKYNELIDYNEEKLCTEGTAEQCEDWKEFRDDNDLVKHRKVAGGFLDQLGIKTGVQWGIGIAIPLAIGLLLWRNK